MRGKVISVRFASFMVLVLFFLSDALTNPLVYARQGGRKIHHIKAAYIDDKVLMQDEGVTKEGLGGRTIRVDNGKLKRPRDGMVSSTKQYEGGNKVEGRSLKKKEGTGFVAISADYQGPKSNPSRHH